GWTSVDGAVASGRAFALQVQDEVLALDADRPDLSRALEHMAAQMREEGLRPVVVASGQDDHRHLFCRIADPDRRERYRQRARAVGLDVRSGASLIRPPWRPIAWAYGSPCSARPIRTKPLLLLRGRRMPG